MQDQFQILGSPWFVWMLIFGCLRWSLSDHWFPRFGSGARGWKAKSRAIALDLCNVGSWSMVLALNWQWLCETHMEVL